MPPQKRGRSDKKAAEDAEMAQTNASATDAAGAAPGRGRSDDDDDSDSDSDDDDDLTFAEAMDDDDDDDEDEEDADGDDDMKGAQDDPNAAGRLVNVEFVFSDPREAHFHSVKQFLLSYLPSSQPLHVSNLAELVVQQVTAGTMVCVEGEDDVYGFITALGLGRYASAPSVQQVLQYVTKRCPAADAGRFQEILRSKSVGLVLNERMINLPYQLVPPLHSALHEDLEWAMANEATPELRQGFAFDYFLILASCTLERVKGAGSSSSSQKKKKKAKTTTTDYEAVATAKYYANFEDEFLEQAAEVVFAFETPRGDRERERGELAGNKHTVVMLIERTRHKDALATIANMINM